MTCPSVSCVCKENGSEWLEKGKSQRRSGGKSSLLTFRGSGSGQVVGRAYTARVGLRRASSLTDVVLTKVKKQNLTPRARRGGWREVLCTDLPLEEIRCDFDYSWHRIRYRIGEGRPLVLAHRLAVERPLTLPETDPWHELPVYVMFVSLAGRLQILRADEPIFLPCQRIGELLHRCKMQITRYCDNAIENGYLEIGEDHSFVKRRAMEYRFVVDRFPEQLAECTPQTCGNPPRLRPHTVSH